MSTGNIKLNKTEDLVPSGSVQLVTLHLLGEHDQSTHGRGGGGSNEGNTKSVPDSTLRGASRLGTEGAAKLDSGLFGPGKSTLALDKTEKSLEVEINTLTKNYDNAFNRGDYSRVNEIVAEANPKFKDLDTVRRKIYTEEGYKRIYRAESVLDSLNKHTPRNAIEEEIVSGGKVWWGDEVVRAHKEGRGQKGSPLTQPIGKSIDSKNGEWNDITSSRQVDQIAKGGFLKNATVDGIEVRSAYEVTAKDGAKIRMYDLTGKDKIKGGDEILNAMAGMHELYPYKPPKKLVVVNTKITDDLIGLGKHTNAFVFPGTDMLFINKDVVHDSKSEPGWKMPISSKVSSASYVIAHEYGHQFDFSNRRSASVGLFENEKVRSNLSNYGKTMAQEGYAEAFAEWHLSKGETRNPAAIAYARHQKWYNHDRVVRTAEGAKKYGVSIGQKIPVAASVQEVVSVDPGDWDPWVIARELGIISMATEEKEEVKIEFSRLKDIPVIVDDWKNGPKLLNMEPLEATKEEKQEAETVAREVWAELGLEWEEEAEK